LRNEQKQFLRRISIALAFLLILTGISAWLAVSMLGTNRQTIVPESAPGVSIGGVVRNEDGEGVPDARLTLHWIESTPMSESRTGRTIELTADSQGHWNFNGIPGNALPTLSIGVKHADYFDGSFNNLNANDLANRQEVLSLSRVWNIRGQVVDASGHPISGAWVSGILELRVPGVQNDDIGGVSTDSHGRFSLRGFREADHVNLSTQSPGYAKDVRVVYAGWADNLRITLTPGRQIEFCLLTPDGQPAAGAKIALAAQGQDFTVLDGNEFRGQHLQSTRGDPDGQFNFPPQSGPFMLYATHPSGYLQLYYDQLPASGNLTLTPWGRVEGRLSMNGAAMTSQPLTIELNVDASDDESHHEIAFCRSTENTDKSGRFVFDRVQAGAHSFLASVDLGTDTRYGYTSGIWYPMADAVTVAAGQTAKKDVAFTGRPWMLQLKMPPGLAGRQDCRIVVNCQTPSAGETILDREFPVLIMPDEISEGTDRQQTQWHSGLPRSAIVAVARYSWWEQRRWSRFNIASFGDRVRVENVLPGNYTANVNAYFDNGPEAFASEDITIPPIAPGSARTPYVVSMQLFEMHRLDIGSVAPPFPATLLDGKPFNLSDHRGQFVLLEFWVSQWPGQQTLHLKAVYDRFSHDPRFTMIGLDGDKSIDDLKQYLAPRKVPWPQAYIGNMGTAKLSYDYGTGDMPSMDMPSIYLIGPEGKIIAKDLKGDAIMAAVEKVLGK
jgi:hypothetical protein